MNNRLVEQFQLLYFEKYGTKLTYEAAEVELTQLAELVRITSEPIKDENDHNSHN